MGNAANMILSPQNPAFHNQMLGQRIPHPPSTRSDDDFALLASKRVKRLHSTADRPSQPPSDGEDYNGSPRPTSRRNEAADSEADSDEEGGPLLHPSQTELEIALPPVKTDKEAIADYEATRATEAGLNLHDRLGQRKWVQGKSSIYVDAFNLALDTVLDEESHLFNDPELAVFRRWRDLSYEGQYLYVHGSSF